MKILITGMSGLLGLNAAALLRHSATVCGSYFDHRVSLAGVAAHRVDVTDASAVTRWFRDERPDLVWHAAGLTNVDRCEADPALARRLNVNAAAHVADAAATVGAQLVHVSTDHLFDGKRGLRTETDDIGPLNVYAATKAEAEAEVLARHPSPLLVRTNFFGWGHLQRRSFSDWVIDTLRHGGGVSLFTDVHFSPVLVTDLVTTTMELVASGASGVYHVAGSQRVSKFEFGLALATQFGLDSALIQASSVSTASLRARRPLDMSLDVSRAASRLGRPLQTLAQSVQGLAELESRGWPQVLTAAIADREQ